MNMNLKMKQIRGQGMAFAAALAAATVLLSSCIYDDEPTAKTGDDAYVMLKFTAGESVSVGTRAADTNPGTTEENTFKSMRVWVFVSGDSSPLAYKEETGLNEISGSHTIQMKLPKSVIGNRKKIDLYILANGESGSDLSGTDNRQKTRQQLKDSKIGNNGNGNEFGLDINGKNRKAHTTSVPTTGLPMSRAVTDIDFETYASETKDGAKPISVRLHRAVTKFHMFFARKAGVGLDRAYITKVCFLADNAIALSEYTFPGEEQFVNDMPDRTSAKSVKTEGIDFDGNVIYGETPASDITTLPDGTEPEAYKKTASETAKEYMERLKKAGIVGHNLSYFCESYTSKIVRIYYKLSPTCQEYSSDVEIPKEAFLRNREVVVYAYFKDNKVNVSLQYHVIDWTDGGGDIGYN